ncbi:hypothetical protein N657DRAFT_187132 [Parathielavia appendiculata]|uniref:Ankyrin repeat protein n=1 Tax=Parathielavia appendiculata TaxID=2587402 RepID=A0AAN6U6F6_9PEZI|nr:hypothetical protein N657DRAFT_187132 [Parathielavia appendiculata]
MPRTRNRNRGSAFLVVRIHSQPSALLELGVLPDGRHVHRVTGEICGCEICITLATPLRCAACRGQITCLDVLLEHGASINQIEGEVGSCLHAARLVDDGRHLSTSLRRVLTFDLSAMSTALFIGRLDTIKIEKSSRYASRKDSPGPTLLHDASRNMGPEVESYDADFQEILIDRVMEIWGERYSQTLKDAIHRCIGVVGAYPARKECFLGTKRTECTARPCSKDLEIFNLLTQQPSHIDI